MTNNPGKPVIKVGVEADDSSFLKLEQKAASTFEHISSLTKANDAVASSADKAGSALSSAFEKSRKKLLDTSNSVKDLRLEIEKTNKEADKTEKGQLRVEGLRRAGGALSQLGFGEAGAAVSRVGDLGQLKTIAGELITELGPLAPVMVAATGAAVGLKVGMEIMNRQLEAVGKQLEKSSNQLKIYYNVIESGTTKSIQDQLRLAKAEQAKADQEVKTREAAYSKIYVTDDDNALQSFIKTVAELRPEAQKLRDDLDAAKKAASDADDKVQALTSGVGSFNVKINDFTDLLNKKSAQALQLVIELTKRYAEEQAKLGAALRKSGDIEIERIRSEQKTNQELLTSTYEQVQSRIKSIEEEKAINDKIILTRGLANGQLDRNSDEYKRNVAEIQAATESNKNLNRELGNLTQALDILPAEIKMRNDRVIEVQKKHEEDVKAIEVRSLQERANIQEQYNQKLVDIAKQFAKDADDAYKREIKTFNEAKISLDRDLSKQERDEFNKEGEARLKLYRDEQRATREHVIEVEKIKRQGDEKEIGYLLHRDFLGLYEHRLQVGQDISQSNTDFGNKGKEQEIANQENIDDLRRTLRTDQSERRKAYQQQLDDAKANYQEDLNLAEAKRVEERRMAETSRVDSLRIQAAKSRDELNIKNSQYKDEIKMASYYGKARLDILTKIDNEYLKRANETLAKLKAGTSGGSTAAGMARAPLRRATGGDVEAYDIVQVNEGYPGQQETFNGVPLPRGMGTFIPNQAGSIGQAKAEPSVNIHQSFEIVGVQNEQDIIRKVLPVIRSETAKTVKVIIKR